jgi:hypothetical protein
MKIPANYPFTISPNFGDIHFVDLYTIPQITNTSRTVDELTALFFSINIPFLQSLLLFRKLIVKPFGLKADIIKEQTPLYIRTYEVGQKIGYFTIASKTDNEIVIEEYDKHLTFRIYNSLITNEDGTMSFHNSTIVHYNNTLGRIYFFFVKPFHKLIVSTLIHKMILQLHNSK